MIYFRADANSALGSGHIMRCISIAIACRNCGETCVFLTSDNALAEIIKQQGFENIVLHSQYNRLDGELAKLVPLLLKAKPNCIVVDSYYVTKNWMKTVNSLTKLLYLDDLGLSYFDAHSLVNCNIYAPSLAYEKFYAGTSTKIYSGTKYVPLRREFQNMPPRVVASSVNDILISTGGADSEHIALLFLQYLAQHTAVQDINFHFVLGAMNADILKIKELAKNAKNIYLHENLSCISELMLKCDIAISAAGSTLYELCACGTPTITYIMADNQIQGAAMFEKEELMLNAGDCRNNKTVFFTSLLCEINSLCANFILRKSFSQKMQALVDGNGATHLANIITSL